MEIKKAIRQPISKWNRKQNIEIQGIEWIECDEVIKDETEEFEDKENPIHFYDKEHNKRFVIFCFGVSSEGHSVCITL